MQELQVLRSLLAPYTDEKLNELQLLIQKSHEGEISREEVEKSLRQSGLTMIADRLKDDIEKGKENSTVYIIQAEQLGAE
jgi:NCAIR mutase (PurE)-related protein